MTFAGMVPGVLGAIVRDASRLPEHLPDATRVDRWTEATSRALLFSVPGIARYLVENGTTIDVEAMPGTDKSSVELFVHGPARGSLIHQRGELPLEAATIVAPRGAAVALAGSSGVGKSTLAAELCRRGWRLIADDITRVTWTGGRPVAWPSHDALKLWQDACESFGIGTENLRPTRAGMKKFYVKMPAASAPTVLRAVVRLELDSAARLANVPAEQCATILSDCTFRKRQIEAMQREDDHERIVLQTSSVCRIMVLSGMRKSPINALADQIVRGVM